MYCINCGKEVLEGAKFCSNCGTATKPNNESKVEKKELKEENLSRTVVQDDNKELRDIMDTYISEYNNKYKGSKDYMAAPVYMNSMNVLSKYRLMFLILPIAALTVICGPLGPIIGFIFGIIPYVLACANGLRKENSISLPHNITNVRDLCDYLIGESWTMKEMMPESCNENSILIRFKDQTLHHITFDFTNNTYTITCRRCTRKQVIKSGFQHSSALMFKNSVKLNPILKAHIEYFGLKSAA